MFLAHEHTPAAAGVDGRRRKTDGAAATEEAKVAPTRAVRLLAFAGDVVAVVVILDTLARLGRDDHRMSARSADIAADRLRADPALGRHPLGHPPVPASGRLACP